MPPLLAQQNQPPGVSALELTGERTLPDIPAENYWFQRHLAVYEWVADRCRGQRVADLACGEGYGSDLIARRAAEVVGVDANPETFEHARARYCRPNLSFERTLVEWYQPDRPVDAVVLLQTIEHLQDPDHAMSRFRAILAEGGACYVSTPNVLTLAPEGANRSDNPFHLREYRAEEFRALAERHFERVELYGLFHSRRLRLHDWALKAGWDRIHRTLGATELFYDRFTPSIGSADFVLRRGNVDRALDLMAVCR